MKLFIYIVLGLMLFSCNMFKPTIITVHSSRKETVMTIDDVIYNPETGISYSYTVDGEKYTFGKNYNVSKPIAVGTKYVVAYNPDDPRRHITLSHKPVLEESEGVRYTIGRTGKGMGKYYLNFKDSIELEIIRKGYSIQANGSLFRGNRRAMINEMGYSREDTEEKLFLVKYWTKNPLRNVMELDQPIAPNEDVIMIFENTDNPSQLNRRLRRAARKVGEEGIIFWAPRNHSRMEITRMKAFLEERKGEYKVKEIEIVDNDNIEELLRKYLENAEKVIPTTQKQQTTHQNEVEEKSSNTHISPLNFGLNANVGYLFLTNEMRHTFRRYFETPLSASIGYNNFLLNFHYFNVIGEVDNPFEFEDVFYDESFRIINFGFSMGYQLRLSPRYTLTPMVGVISSRLTGFNNDDNKGNTYPNLRSTAPAFMLNLDFDALYEDRRQVNFRNGDTRRVQALFSRLQVFYSNPNFNQGDAFGDGQFFMVTLGFGIHWHGGGLVPTH